MKNILKIYCVTCSLWQLDRGGILKSSNLMQVVRGFSTKSNKDMDNVMSNISNTQVNDIGYISTHNQSINDVNKDILLAAEYNLKSESSVSLPTSFGNDEDKSTNNSDNSQMLGLSFVNNVNSNIEVGQNNESMVNSNIDYRNISKYILNKNYIDKVDLSKLDNDFYNLIVYFSLTKKFISSCIYNKIVKNVRKILISVSVSESLIEKIIKDIQSSSDILLLNNHNSGKDSKHSDSTVEDLFYKLHEYASYRKININNEKLDNLLTFITNVLKVDDSELTMGVISVISGIKNKCKSYGQDVIYRSVGSRKHPGREKEWTLAKYEKSFNDELEIGVKDINKLLIQIIFNTDNSNINNVDSISNTVKSTLFDLNKKIAKLLFLNMKYNNIVIFTKESVAKTVSKIDTENIDKFVSGGDRDIQLILKILNDIDNMESLDQSLNKLSSLNTPLMRVIKCILDSSLSNYDKQVAIEKGLIEYEIDYFNKNIGSVEARSKILHKVYPIFQRAYKDLITEYSLNKYLKLKKSVQIIRSTKKSEDNKELYKTLVILVIMYLGVDKCISYSFSQIINLLNTNIEDNKRTNIVINLGNKIIRLLKYSKIEDNSVLDKIFPLSEVKKLLSEIDDTGVFWIGDTLLHLITDNCDIIIEELKWNNAKDSYLILRLNESFVSDLTIGSINLVQLPMLTEPRKLDSSGLYYPYMNTETTNLHLFEGGLIKGKYNQRDKTEGSSILYRSIDYLNSMKFRISQTMLKFILSEWENKDSKIFKGYNIYKPILDTDSKEIKALKQSSNSKYHLYGNIINLASLYKDHEFYLPVFVDFRGRIYPLSNYLNYQGGDLVRSLFLFSNNNNKCLNEAGKECLNIYLANLAGYDKLPWNDRLSKVDLIIKEYLKSTEISPTKYIEDNIDKISEPFQFISIMYAKLLSMKNPKAIINNPILFDASCSGIQHIAALTLEKELASNVNVYTESNEPKSDLPQDFYIYALDKIRTKLSESDIPELRDIKLNRKMIKRSIMTIPYNISMVGVGEHLLEHFETQWVLKERFIKIPGIATASGNDINLNASQFGHLCKIVYFVLTKELPSLRLLSNYFNSMIDIFVKLNIPITWITPAGLKISYTNVKFKTTKVKGTLLRTSQIASIKLPTETLDKLSMKRSFMPNFIHSLDASNVHLLLDNISNFKLPVYTIHDCFAGTANNMFNLEKLVKKAFIDIYFKDEGYLLKLHKHFVETIKSATDPFDPTGYNVKDLLPVGLITDSYDLSNLDTSEANKEENSDQKITYVSDRLTKEIIIIPNLPVGYINKNKKLNLFIKGLLNSKYFIG